MVSVSNISMRFGRVYALNGLTLQTQPGIVGLIGPNGAGKTTLLRILLGLLKPTNGEASVLGLDIKTHSIDIRRRIGVLHERAYFPVSMSTTDYLQQMNRIYETETPIDELLVLVGLSDATDRKIKDLSAGMHQRLGLAQALCGDPELVFLDEPTAHLDVNGRDDIVSLLIQVHKERDVSFLISSHILSELERACHTVAFVKKGTVFDYGTVEELVQKHTQNRFQVMSPNAIRLMDILKHTEGISDALVTGTSSIVVELSPKFESEELISNIARMNGIDIHSIKPTGTLEDVYRSVTRDE